MDWYTSSNSFFNTKEDVKTLINKNINNNNKILNEMIRDLNIIDTQFEENLKKMRQSYNKRKQDILNKYREKYNKSTKEHINNIKNST